MKDFADAIAKLQTGDVLRLLLVLGPLAAAAWVAINWAYKTRIEQLNKSLELLRGDIALELKRLREQLEGERDSAVSAIRAELRAAEARAAETAATTTELRSDFRDFHELTESISKHPDAVWHWWTVFDEKYFGVRAHRRELDQSDPGHEFYDRNPKPLLLAKWEKQRNANASQTPNTAAQGEKPGI